MSLEDEIVELQTKVQYQEDALHKLDEVVIEQGKLIDRLNRQIIELQDRLEQVRYERGDQKDEKPPHY